MIYSMFSSMKYMVFELSDFFPIKLVTKNIRVLDLDVPAM